MLIKKYNVVVAWVQKNATSFEVYAPDEVTAEEIARTRLQDERRDYADLINIVAKVT